MLLIETLRNKPQITINNETIVDLSAKSFDFNRPLNVTGTTIVPEDMAMRPDLIARVYYSTASRLDFVCKFNGISNPFSMDTGDIILIGDESEIESTLRPDTQTDPDKKKQDIRDKFFDPNRLSKKDVKRLDYIQKKALQQGAAASASNLPPNFAEKGSQEITVKDGKVIFGNDVVGNKDNCPEPLDRAKVKAKLLANKIFKTGNQ